MDSFKKLEYIRIHTCWPVDDHEEDDDLVEKDEILIESEYLNGNSELVKIFDQKCVICLETGSDYAFRRCGHQCISEQCY